MTQEKTDSTGRMPEKKGKLTILTEYVKSVITIIGSDSPAGAKLRGAYRLASRQRVCSCSTAWASLMASIPEELMNKGTYGPGLYEKSAYITFMIFADAREHTPGRSIGHAAGQSGSSVCRTRLTRIEDSPDEEVLTANLRTMIKMLAKNGIGVDYGMLARDIFYILQNKDKRIETMQRWERDYAAAAYSSK